MTQGAPTTRQLWYRTDPTVAIPPLLQTAASVIAQAVGVAAPPMFAAPLRWIVERALVNGVGYCLIDFDAEGSLQLVPFRAGREQLNGRYVGYTEPLDGALGDHVSARASATFRLAIPGGAPVKPGTQLYEADAAIGATLLTTLNMPPYHAVGFKDAFFRSSRETRDSMAREAGERIDESRRNGGLLVMPPGIEPARPFTGPDIAEGTVDYYDRLVQAYEARFSIGGLMHTGPRAEQQAHHRRAVVMAFGPMADLIEEEAARKLGGALAFDRDKWQAATHSDMARATNQRAAAVQRLVAAGVPVRAAVELAGFDAAGVADPDAVPEGGAA